MIGMNLLPIQSHAQKDINGQTQTRLYVIADARIITILYPQTNHVKKESYCNNKSEDFSCSKIC